MTEGFDHLLTGAYGRIQLLVVSFGLTAALVTYPYYGLPAAAGVLLGSALAVVNFTWLKASMLAFTSHFAEPEAPPKPENTRLIARFFLRYLLAGAVLFAIIKSSAVSVYGLLAGLLVVVPALLCEAVYEAWHAFKVSE